jgi:DNA-binding NtrC family response regulator
MKHKVLLVNANGALLLLQKAHLSRVGYDVHIARNVFEAEMELRTTLFSMVITELRFSESDSTQGLKVIEKVNAVCTGTPILVLTSSANSTLHRKARSLGVWDILVQPSPLADLELVMRNILDEIYRAPQLRGFLQTSPGF